jgi:TetR/AcrR family transcriptional repressor of nem operon
MGRKKSYDSKDVLRSAMELFWANGYDATSIKMITDHLGINKFSLYSEFGSKKELLSKSIDFYREEVMNNRYEALNITNGGISEISKFLKSVKSMIGTPGFEKGCFLSNIAGELNLSTSDYTSQTDNYFEYLCKSFQNPLNNSKLKGELRKEIKVKQESRFLVCHLIGVSQLRRSLADPLIIKDSLDVMIIHLKGLFSTT